MSQHKQAFYDRFQPVAGPGHKMLFVTFVFSKSRFQGPAFRCDKIVAIVTLLEAIKGIPDKGFLLLGERQLPQSLRDLLHERKLKSGYLERRIYERPLHLRVNLLSRIKANIFQNVPRWPTGDTAFTKRKQKAVTNITRRFRMVYLT